MTQKKQIIDKKREIIKDLQRDRDTLVRLMALISAEMPAGKDLAGKVGAVGEFDDAGWGGREQRSPLQNS